MVTWWTESFIRGHLIWKLWSSWVISVFCSLKSSQNTEITQTCFINFILNDHSCRILYISYSYLSLNEVYYVTYVTLKYCHNSECITFTRKVCRIIPVNAFMLYDVAIEPCRRLLHSLSTPIPHVNMIKTESFRIACRPLETVHEITGEITSDACLVCRYGWKQIRKCVFRVYADSKGPHQTAHPRSLIRAFAVRLQSLGCKQQRLVL